MEVIHSMRRMEFPESCERALEEIGACLNQSGGGIPGLGQVNANLAFDIADEFIFHRNSRSRKKLSSVEELHVLQLIIEYFHPQRNSSLCNQVFSTLFGGKLSENRTAFLTKLVSIAVGLKNKALIDCAAQWIQDQGHNSPGSCLLVKTLVEDFCLLLPGSLSILSQLPEISLHFTCNFIATLTVIYSPYSFKEDSRPVVPYQLLKLVTDWISNSHTICLVSLQYPTRSQSQSATLWAKPIIQTPIPGLLSWCILAPLMCEIHNPEQIKITNAVEGGKPIKSGNDNVKHLALYSQLFLGILHTLLSFQNTGSSTKLINVQDVLSLSQTTRHLMEQVDRAHESGLVNTAVDRLAQFLQTALAVRALKCHKEDINRIFQFLPQNKLLDMIRIFHS